MPRVRERERGCEQPLTATESFVEFVKRPLTFRVNVRRQFTGLMCALQVPCECHEYGDRSMRRREHGLAVAGAQQPLYIRRWVVLESRWVVRLIPRPPAARVALHRVHKGNRSLRYVTRAFHIRVHYVRARPAHNISASVRHETCESPAFVEARVRLVRPEDEEQTEYRAHERVRQRTDAECIHWEDTIPQREHHAHERTHNHGLNRAQEHHAREDGAEMSQVA